MKKGSYGSLESVSTNKYILRLMSDMKKLYMCNLEKVILFNIMKRTTTLLSALILALSLWAQTSVETQRQYLSGKGCDDMVEWDFFCTGGNNSGKWSKIGVPSCWELQGFGTYQYGMKFYGKAFPAGVADEKGMYRYEFNLPAEWNGMQVELVFEGSMTDTYATINGRKAGEMHQGAFYRFVYNVSDRVFSVLIRKMYWK